MQLENLNCEQSQDSDSELGAARFVSILNSLKDDSNDGSKKTSETM